MNQQEGTPNVANSGTGGSPGRPASANPAEPLRRTAGEGAVGPETPVWEGRGDWRYQISAVAMFLIVSVVILILLGFFIDTKGKNWLWWLGAIVVLAFGVRMAWILIVHIYATRYRLTTQRLFIDRGILSRTTDQLELIRVDDVRVRQRLLDRMFGIGSVDVLSTDVSDAKMSIIGIGNPDTVAEHIRSSMRQLRQKSLFIENL